MIEYTVKTKYKQYDYIEYRVVYSNRFYKVGDTFVDEDGDENTILRIDRNNKWA